MRAGKGACATTTTRTANGSRKYSRRFLADPMSSVHVSESDAKARNAAAGQAMSRRIGRSGTPRNALQAVASAATASTR